MAVETEMRIGPGRSVCQILPSFSQGDAISRSALQISRLLQEAGYVSRIFAQNRDPVSLDICENISRLSLTPGDAVIYHHSIGSDVTEIAIRHAGPRLLVYHNITPARFYLDLEPEKARLLEEGRRQLPELAKHFPRSAADSPFNLEELVGAGFSSPQLLPILIDPERWNIPGDTTLQRRMRLSGGPHILFVGRIVPNKCQTDLVDLFREILVYEGGSHLWLVGEGYQKEPYLRMLLDRISRGGLAGRIHVTGKVTESQLRTLYQNSDLYLSMSAHEGFGVPLLEAALFDLPVAAVAAGAIPWTLGEGAILFPESAKEDLEDLARRCAVLLRDTAVRKKVVERQRKNLERFLPGTLIPLYLAVFEGLFSSSSL